MENKYIYFYKINSIKYFYRKGGYMCTIKQTEHLTTALILVINESLISETATILISIFNTNLFILL